MCMQGLTETFSKFAVNRYVSIYIHIIQFMEFLYAMYTADTV